MRGRRERKERGERVHNCAYHPSYYIVPTVAYNVVGTMTRTLCTALDSVVSTQTNVNTICSDV